MTLLTNAELVRRINSTEKDRIFIDPILSDDQIGAVSVDLRLGCDFLVSVLSQNASIDLMTEGGKSGPEAFFQATRRDIGDVFMLHPTQTVLATSLEYIGLPFDVYSDIMSRSSYHRLGVSVVSMFQPGFRGCVSLELFNHSNVPIELIVGSRIVQARFYRNEHDEVYIRKGARRKYIGNVRPSVSLAATDSDIPTLRKLRRDV